MVATESLHDLHQIRVGVNSTLKHPRPGYGLSDSRSGLGGYQARHGSVNDGALEAQNGRDAHGLRVRQG
jgi:hypothetical protein